MSENKFLPFCVVENFGHNLNVEEIGRGEYALVPIEEAHRLAALDEENTRLKAELAEARKENYADDFNFEHYRRQQFQQENTRLKERLAKLENGINQALNAIEVQEWNSFKEDAPDSGVLIDQIDEASEILRSAIGDK